MRFDDVKFLKRFSNEFENLFPDGVDFGGIISEITNGKLSIEKDGRDIAKRLEQSAIAEIKNTLPYLIRITEKPHSFIKTYEDKVNVASAKRINSKAISHLSRDSNDWFARTFLTVIPKNILTDLNEETFNLYENRFIVTLIDRILNIVIEERIRCEKLYEELNNDRIQKKLEDKKYIPVQKNENTLLKLLLRNKNKQKSNTSFEEARDILNSMTSLERKIKNMKQSHLYHELRKSRRERNPIQKTNIVIFDPRYNAAYRLWEYLDNENLEEVSDIDDAESICFDMWYELFVFITVSASLKDMGFIIKKDCTVQYKNNELTMQEKSLWERDGEEIQLFYSKNAIELDYCLDKKRDKWDKAIITPEFSIDFENKTSNEIIEQTDSIIQKLVKESNSKKNTNSHFYCLSADIQKCSDASDWGEKVYRRLSNIGDNYSNDEKNINEISFYKTGILLVSLDDFRENFLRIKRFVNSRVYKTKMNEIHSAKCLICGGKIRRLNDNEIICNDCLHYISKSSCSNPECNTEFLWIKYRDDKFLDDKDISGNFENCKYYIKLQRSEFMMGEYAITSFVIEKETNTWKLKSICPKCGRRLGE